MGKNTAYTEIYHDDNIVVLNKSSGILTAADRYNPDIPRLDLEAEKEFGRLFAVHRIDKDTSGLVIYARNADAHRELSIAFERRQVQKTYHALVYGRPTWTDKTVTARLLVNGDDRHRTIINRRGKDAETVFHLIGTCGPFSWIEASPKTGRTHQIRAHLSDLGISIVCDPLYGGNQKPVFLSEIKRSWRGDTFEEKPLLSRLALHAWKLTLAHPQTKETITFTAPYPRDLNALRNQLFKLYKVNPIEDNA
ncbi:MAG: RluA family pseudouridine synthase [Spirochaetaceae bacterium]|nr:RluA family pseudouridine synthase [Spirochaetaceae bacterium]